MSLRWRPSSCAARPAQPFDRRRRHERCTIGVQERRSPACL